MIIHAIRRWACELLTTWALRLAPRDYICGALQACVDATARGNKLQAEVDGWHRTALAMRDAAIVWQRDGKSHSDVIQRLYFDAALFKRFVPPNAQ